MALISCPECNHEISDKAHFCPHCGCPTALMPKPDSGKRIILSTGNVTSNAFATVLRILSVVTAIGGVILAIVLARAQVQTRYTTETVFSWGLFFGILIGSLIYASVIWSIAGIIDMIQGTYDMVYGLRIEQVDENSRSGYHPSNASARPLSSVAASGKSWRCPKCGTVNSEADRSCKDCGEWR